MHADDTTFVRRAELLWAFSTVIGEEQQAAVAAWLEFEPKQPDAEPLAERSGGQNTVFQSEDVPAVNNAVDAPVGLPTYSAYYRVKDRQANTTQTDTVDEQDTKPDWFARAQPTFLQETTTRIPLIHQVVPEYPPLVPWSRLYAFLQRQLGAQVEGHKPDVARLVSQVANGKQIKHIPRQTHFTWSPRLRVLLDINDSNFPYRKDFIQLREQLLRWRGGEGLSIQYLCDTPGGKVCWFHQGRERVTDWHLPERDESLLILSDLSLQSRSRRGLYQWLSFGEMLNLNGIRPLVLMPIAERELDKRLLQYFRCIVWDRNSQLKVIQAGKPDVIEKQGAGLRVEQLLALLFPTLRVDLGLLRAIRYLLPADEFDVGHEAAVWGHIAVNRSGDEWGWHDNSKEAFQPLFIRYFAALSADDQRKLVDYLGSHHAQFPDELYFEAMDELIRLKLPVPDTVAQATHDFLSVLVKTYDTHPEHQGLGNWVKRYLERHDYSAMRANSDHQIAFMAIERERSRRSNQDGNAQTLEWPDGFPLEKAFPLINRQQSLQQYLLRQKSNELTLVHADWAAQQDDDWGQPVVLLKMFLRDTVIFHRYTTLEGEVKQVSLHLDKGKETQIPFPPAISHELQSGRETLGIAVSSVNDKAPWMKFTSSGSREGLYAESTTYNAVTKNDDIYRWYWHPPEWSRDKGILPGVWYGSKQLDKAQRDTYGFHTDITIAGIPQRFRWIEPTAFQMGSPKDEKGRSDDEIQHEVILTQGYWLAETACTQALWQAVTGDNPSDFKGENNPVENVSWQDVTDEFLKRVNKQYPQLKLRLPTEAEWENACRAGTTGAFNFEGELSLDKVNYRGTWDDYDKWGQGALQKTVAVKSYPPNQWGLYEMHGNVWEWCQDWYGSYSAESVIDPQGSASGSLRVLRGGSWFLYGRFCRSAYRDHSGPGNRSNLCGFRLALGHELSPVRSVRAVQQPLGSHAAAARGGQAGDGQRSSASKTADDKKGKSMLDRIKDIFKR